VLQAVAGVVEKAPLFVSLKEWSDSGKSLLGFIETQFDICGFPDASRFVSKVLDKGTALVLFDGLDEVRQADAKRDNTISELKRFTDKYHKTQCIITCRVAATSYSFDKFRYVELADFTQEQVTIYVNKWFDHYPEKASHFFAEYLRSENKSLSELARTPLLLGLLCLAFDSTLSFPKRRVELYEEAIEALLKRWDSSRAIQRDEAYRGLSLGRKRQMFARIAAVTFERKEYFVREKVIAESIVEYLSRLPDAPPPADIDGSAVLRAIEAQHGIFCERAKDIFSFAHLTFQEYFTAKYILEDTSGRARHALLNPNRIADPRWREVILLTASLLDDADEFMAAVSDAVDGIRFKDTEVSDWILRINRSAEGIDRPIEKAAIRACYLLMTLNSLYRDVVGEDGRATIDRRLVRARLSTHSLSDAHDIDIDDETALQLYEVRSKCYELCARLSVHAATMLEAAGIARPFAVSEFTRTKAINLSGATTERIPLNIARAIEDEMSGLISRLKAVKKDGEHERYHAIHLDLLLNYLANQALCYSRWRPADEELGSFVEHIHGTAVAVGEGSVASALAALDVPVPSSGRWKQFSERVELLIADTRGFLRSISVSPDRCKLLLDYLDATLLFAEALDVAAVSERPQLRDRILRA
jgi:NACHT domain-containing protein